MGEVTLESLCVAIVDCEHKTALKATHGLEFGRSIGTPNIRNGRINFESAKKVDRATYEAWTVRMRPQPGDIILTREAPVGEAGLVDSDHRVCLGQRTVLIRPALDRIVPRYLHYLLLGPEMQERMHERAEGSTVPHLNVAEIRRLQTGPLPSRLTQAAIAAVLGALDDKIAVNERIAAAADELCSLLFDKRFHDVDGDNLPPGWRKGVLAELCATQYGYTTSATNVPVGPRLLRVKDINKQNWIDWNSVPYCSTPPANGRYRLSMGDIVVARMADPGKSAIIEQQVDAVFASYLVRLQTQSLAYAYYVYGFLKSKAYADYCAGARAGSVQANMNAKVIVDTRLPIPPVFLMKEHLDEVLPLRQRLHAALRETTLLIQLRDMLLPKLMSGELRVKDVERIAENAT